MPDAAMTRAAVSAPDIPEDAGYWLYFAYAALTRHVAHRDSANVPKKSKILSPVILFLILKYSSPLPLQSHIAVFLAARPHGAPKQRDLRFFLFPGSKSALA